MKAVITERFKNGDYILSVTCSCGHRAELAYGSREAAQNDTAEKEAAPCWPCRNEAMIKKGGTR